MKIWYFHGQYKANGLGTNKISYVFNLRHVSKVAAHFQKKNKMFIYSFKYPNEESGKISMMEHICENTTAKTFIIDVWYGSKYTPEVVQDSKINLKWINTKMLEKTAFLQCGPCRAYPYVGISQDIRSNTLHKKWKTSFFVQCLFPHVLLKSHS